MNFRHTKTLIPDGVQTLSKRPCCYVEDVYPDYLVRGNGSYVWDLKDKRYIDYHSALGAIILGINNQKVSDAVCNQMREGNLFSLSHPKETELAELMRETFPSMQVMRFVKTGSEACSAAIKVARAYTEREAVITCGYHGWHEWYNCTTPKNAGSYPQPVYPVEWGNLEKLKELLETKKPAAFITEPYIYADEKEVEKWLKESRKLCVQNKALFILDENVTGFRTTKLGAQNHWKVKPDLSVFGKSMGNGVPIACFGGLDDIMGVLKKDCFVSSTFGGDLLGIVAAIETIKLLKSKPIIHHIWTMGSKLKTGFNQSAEAAMKESIRCVGLPPRTHFLFPSAEHKSLFWQECLDQGIFFGHNNFVTAEHSIIDIDTTLSVIRHAMKILLKNWDAPMKALRGKVAIETLRMVTVPAPNKKKETAKDIIEKADQQAEEIKTDKQKRTSPPLCKKCGNKHWPMHKCKV